MSDKRLDFLDRLTDFLSDCEDQSTEEIRAELREEGIYQKYRFQRMPCMLNYAKYIPFMPFLYK